MHAIQTLGENCVGCGVCMNVCPNDAITMVVGTDGFYAPKINGDKCVSCGKCDRVCPQLGNRRYENTPNPVCYALAAPDELRSKGSSGGAFPLFAECILQDGGKVYGCAYGEGMRPEHIGVDTLEMLPRLYRSKYVESYMGYVYREVEADLKAGRSVLFCGTPCHIAALKAYLSEEYERLYLVDLICHSASPAGVFEEYIKEVQSRFGKRIVDIDFRDKAKGWGMHVYDEPLPFVFEDGSRFDSKDDPYFIGFQRCLFKKAACDTCYYCAMSRQGDLTIGDFWGIDELRPELNDGKGLSLVLVNSEKGEALLNRVASVCKTLERMDCDIRRYNRFFNAPVSIMKKEQKAHFYALREKRPVSEAIERALGQKYDIGLVGDWSVFNYGSELTYYALYQFLTDVGYDVLMVERTENKRYDYPTKTPELFAHNPYPDYALAPIYPDLVSMKELNAQCNTFLLGSDTLWHSCFLYHASSEYLLAFADTDKRKVTYATSFCDSAPQVSNSDIIKMRYLFKRLHRISVRERSGVDICREYFNVHAEHVLDPVFLCDPAHYHALAEQSPVDCSTPYIFCYILRSTEQKRVAIETMAKRLGKRVVCVFMYDYDEKHKYTFDGIDYLNLEAQECSVEDWLRYIKHSDMVLTDSYHGHCFSMIFEKKVIPMLEQFGMFPVRFRSLATLLGLKEPAGLMEILDDSNASDISYPIDYSVLAKRLDEERVRCKQWLLEALGSELPASSDRADLLWDIIGVNMLTMEEEIKRLKQENNRLKYAGKDVVVFGAGRALSDYFEAFAAANITIKCVADNDPNKWGSILPYGAGVACISPNELKNMGQPFVVISVQNERIVKEIKAQLNAMGIRGAVHISELF